MDDSLWAEVNKAIAIRLAGIPRSQQHWNEDRAQELRLKVWQALQKWDPEKSSARTWISRNIFWLAKVSIGEIRWEDDCSLIEAQRDPLSETKLSVRRLLATLGPEQQELIKALYWDGFLARELAAMWRCSTSAISKWRCAALRQLRETLEKDARNPLTVDRK